MIISTLAEYHKYIYSNKKILQVKITLQSLTFFAARELYQVMGFAYGRHLNPTVDWAVVKITS